MTRQIGEACRHGIDLRMGCSQCWRDFEDSQKPASDLSTLTRERDDAVRLLRDIVDGPGVECIPDADIQARLTAFLATVEDKP